MPLFFSETASIAQYLPKNSLVIYLPETKNAANKFWTETSQRYEQFRHDNQRAILPPTKILLPNEELFSELNQFPQVQITTEKVDKFNFNTQPLTDITIDHRHKQPLHKLNDYLQNNPAKILFCTETLGRQDFVANFLRSAQINPVSINSWQEFLASRMVCILRLRQLVRACKYKTSRLSLPKTNY